MQGRTLCLIIILTFIWNKTASAVNSVKPDLLCLLATERSEKKYKTPKNLLRAISIVESGRWNSEHKLATSWPWIVGIDGKGYYFNSYSEAAIFLRKSVAKGANVDIGCHQINWKHHGHNFNHPEDLLHPKRNAEYAAHFLRTKFEESKDWSKAVAHYHSYTPSLGSVYLKKVNKIFTGMKGDLSKKYATYIGTTEAVQSHMVDVRNFNKYDDKVLHAPLIPVQSIVVFSRDVELPVNSTILD